MDKNIERSLAALNSWFSNQHGVAVAYSGGMDSAFLALAAKRAIGKASRAFLVVSEVMSLHEIDAARAAAVRHDLDLVEVPLSVLPLEAFTAHPPDRCYHCKKHVFTSLLGIKPDGWVLADGSNVDDRSDHRPGRRALAELGIASPLELAGFGKRAIREILISWNAADLVRPPGPCLATRIPFGTRVTAEMLQQIQAGESILREAGFSDCRLRHLGASARIEVPPGEVARAESLLPDLVAKFKALGFTAITVDPAGYRKGAMNAPAGHPRQPCPI
ncbi:MAG TPA: ATP-dependent sacrificial sulfur transferase LarE [Candidatus Ozemobacteraceae bacterium]|nr:ATP-dependent sacrificial sulfur transferase LarE [Candidatus Ozemobacteraceae bacterium]HQG27461.1 ATP-dependent sacrificial sulfur transferase LarE [Candidatus Ozemobacteraceae bacterium]